MLFKLSFKNLRKSFKDYAIYFLTLILGVAIFYMFNSLDSQQAMINVSQSTKQMIKLMIELLKYVSVFVSIILGLLIVYANRFLINRRKKEFGIYMTLGMGKRKISKIILLETIFVGIISLGVGLAIGIFASQFMSVLVAKLFEADMMGFKFVFSKDACIKTCIYFAVMYVFVLLFNTFTISRYKLINLLTATKKNEKVKIKNPVISIIVFVISCIILGWAYIKVTKGVGTFDRPEKLLAPILMGIAGTILIFWSLSGFILRVVQTSKKLYLKDTNMFVLRQINNKINTTVISISVICIMLFMTISILSFSLSLQSSLKKDFKELTPVDLNLYKVVNLEEEYGMKQEPTEAQIKDTIQETLINNGFDINYLKDIVEIPVYNSKDITFGSILGSYCEEVKKQYKMLNYDMKEDIIKVSDYNEIAKLYGKEEFKLNDNEYITICDYNNMIELRNKALQKGNNTIRINGKEYKSKYNECKDGFYLIVPSHMNTGFIIVPDNCNLTENMKRQQFLAANYNADKEEEKEKIDLIFIEHDSELKENLNKNKIILNGETKINLKESSVGISTIIIFIAIYLGIIFLIASSAILALKQLTESSDNKLRYDILRKIGCDEKMINQALFRQIGIFFLMPLILAIIHSIFGIQFLLSTLEGLASKDELIPSIAGAVIVIGIIYGAYFLATYLESKNIIKEAE